MRLPVFLLGLALLLGLAPPVLTAAAPPTEEAAVPEHSDEEVTEAREEFDSIDTNHDGFITREEILEMDEVPEREEIDEFFSTYDTNSDGRVTFDEILKADETVRAHAKCLAVSTSQPPASCLPCVLRPTLCVRLCRLRQLRAESAAESEGE